ncbi:hypothetical protein HIM_11270 [Hirsutella minnesotensis 3608]|uniref:Vacuolar membrane protein n=1 Tax=Hirsutella minnesotensis 3608 TaxID=1043627 RepID=A0A0F7ZRC0_9HYPO|nr:hypothetical protein HIM_11270 [Hirsutella minnesotensis 3608]
MGCLSHRKKQTQELTDLKWDLINLADFKAKGCGPGFFYGYLWFSLLLSIAVYAVDSFTAVNLLVFNKWSSKIEPAIPSGASKWIFSSCIIASFVNLAYEGVRATRVMKRGNVAECYMDSLAARWESIRLGSGQGWKRFLVFTELTKSKKGAENIAFFTYFSFQSWIRVILCSGPRQVVNALTIKALFDLKLHPEGHDVGGSIVNFFDKIRILATQDYQQAAILCGMSFTLVVWIFSALFLLIAVLFYVFFLFHWVPRADGGLTGYCGRKVNQRLKRIVTTKVNKALAKGQAKREKADAWTSKKGELPSLDRAGTLPTIPSVSIAGSDDTLPEMPSLARTGTGGTLPLYSSRPGTPNNYELGAMYQQRPNVVRPGTSGSGFSSRAPLVASAAQMGESDYPIFAPPQRPGTANSQASFNSRPGFRGPPRQFEEYGGRASPALSTASRPAYPPPVRQFDEYSSSGRASPAPSAVSRPGFPARQFTPYAPDGRASPAPSAVSRPGYPPPRWASPAPSQLSQAYSPARSMTGPVQQRMPQYPPQRNMTDPVPQRSQSPQFEYDYEAQRGPGYY